MRHAMIVCLLFGCLMTSIQYGQFLLAVATAAMLAFVAFGKRLTTATGYVTVKGHSHGGAYSDVCDHEGGHAAGFDITGGRLLEARVDGNERSARGYTVGYVPNDPASQVGIYLAGFAAAPGTSSNNDQHLVDQVLARVPVPYRSHILSEGQRIARRAAASSRAASYSKRLQQKGRL